MQNHLIYYSFSSYLRNCRLYQGAYFKAKVRWEVSVIGEFSVILLQAKTNYSSEWIIN